MNTNTNIHNRDVGIQGSIANGRFSFYDAGLGACGVFNSGNDFVSFEWILCWVIGNADVLSVRLFCCFISDCRIEFCCMLNFFSLYFRREGLNDFFWLGGDPSSSVAIRLERLLFQEDHDHGQW